MARAFKKEYLFEEIPHKLIMDWAKYLKDVAKIQTKVEEALKNKKTMKEIGKEFKEVEERNMNTFYIILRKLLELNNYKYTQKYWEDPYKIDGIAKMLQAVFTKGLDSKKKLRKN